MTTAPATPTATGSATDRAPARTGAATAFTETSSPRCHPRPREHAPRPGRDPRRVAPAGSPGAGRSPPPAAAARRPAASPPAAAAPAGRVLPAGALAVRPAHRDRAPIDGGRRIAVLRRRERVLELVDARTGRRLARTGAGIGPAQIAARRAAACTSPTRRATRCSSSCVRPRLELAAPRLPARRAVRDRRGSRARAAVDHAHATQRAGRGRRRHALPFPLDGACRRSASPTPSPSTPAPAASSSAAAPGWSRRSAVSAPA